MKKYNLAVVTGTRAEYGLLQNVLKQINSSQALNLQLLVTGTHLKKEFGNTVDEIINDNFEITQKIDILKYDNTDLGISKTVSYTIDTFSEWFAENKPDACLVLGDRYEIFSVATAAALLNIPVIHISGGDVTKGAKDEWFRHCITKISSLHFPSCEEYRQRVIKMGENPNTVFNVGGLGDENIRKLKFVSLEELSNQFNFNFLQPYCLVTFHPETAGNVSITEQFNALLNVINNYKDIGFVFTKANADSGGEVINKLIDGFVVNNKNCIAFTSMGVVRYLSAMKHAKAVIGNSSSGVVETPTFGVPCVNIGDRQKGRIISDNVICCKTDENDITKAIEKAFSASFIQKTKETKSPYNGGDTSKKIVDIIEMFLKDNKFNKVKEFYDF